MLHGAWERAFRKGASGRTHSASDRPGLWLLSWLVARTGQWGAPRFGVQPELLSYLLWVVPLGSAVTKGLGSPRSPGSLFPRPCLPPPARPLPPSAPSPLWLPSVHVQPGLSPGLSFQRLRSRGAAWTPPASGLLTDPVGWVVSSQETQRWPLLPCLCLPRPCRPRRPRRPRCHQHLLSLLAPHSVRCQWSPSGQHLRQITSFHPKLPCGPQGLSTAL